MVLFGIDADKQLHMALALNDAGTILDQWLFPNSPQGWHSLLQWASTFGPDRQWGIEAPGIMAAAWPNISLELVKPSTKSTLVGRHNADEKRASLARVTSLML
jgi:hypothetical protein